jgi:alkanesulfonate monooxygenase SsuD/methylene tetrahydromethanopterin reductase-like flavin-dependent oxidoreductase (luciferase family)
MKPEFGIAAGLQDVQSYVDWAALAEGCGYDLLGYGDSQCLLPEMSVALAAMATVTSHVTLCPTVTNPITRHPSVLASAFGALQQLSNGRAALCIGTGDSAALSIGEQPARLAGLRDYARAVIALVHGQEATYRARTFRLEWSAPRVPVWLAAGGPKTCALAGAIADGVLLGVGLTEDVVRDAIRRVHEGAVAAGRDPDAIEIWIFSKIYLCDSEQQAWHDLAWTLAASAHHAFRADLEHKFVPAHWQDALARLQDGYAVREHDNLANEGQTNARLVIDTGLVEFLGPRFLLAGPPERVRDRIAEIAGWGVRGFFTSAMFGDPFAYTRAVAEHVLAPLRAASGAR